MEIAPFTSLARERRPPLDELALALASEFREVDVDGACRELDRLGADLAAAKGDSPHEHIDACRSVLGLEYGFAGDRDEYDHPDNSMLDLVLSRRRGLPILLSVVYVEAGRRAGIPLGGIGLPGHYVVGHFGADPPLVLDPFARGILIEPDVPPRLLRAWDAHETVLRMLNNLVAAYSTRGLLANGIQAAKLRLALPLDDDLRDHLTREWRSLHARLN